MKLIGKFLCLKLAVGLSATAVAQDDPFAGPQEAEWGGLVGELGGGVADAAHDAGGAVSDATKHAGAVASEVLHGAGSAISRSGYYRRVRGVTIPTSDIPGWNDLSAGGKHVVAQAWGLSKAVALGGISGQCVERALVLAGATYECASCVAATAVAISSPAVVVAPKTVLCAVVACGGAGAQLESAAKSCYRR